MLQSFEFVPLNNNSTKQVYGNASRHLPVYKKCLKYLNQKICIFICVKFSVRNWIKITALQFSLAREEDTHIQGCRSGWIKNFWSEPDPYNEKL